MIDKPVIETNFPGLNLVSRGKVRDIYDLGDSLLIVATDRISAFDVVMLDPIPDKGTILTQLSEFWLHYLNEIIDNHLSPDRVTEEDIHRHLYTAHMPDPDLLIRTSGEQRISNFLLWQIAYTEIFVTERYWPDFRGIHLLEAIADFQRRERRYGGIGEDGGEVEENPDQIRIAVS